MTKPDFIIIGAMKSATSTLHEQLALQSGIFMSTPKEPNYFSDDDVYDLGEAWYDQRFKDAKPDDLCGESSTHYTKLPDYPLTIQRMAQRLKSPKLIYVMRNPIDRLVSHYIHQWSQNVICCDINEAIVLHPELISYSCYGKQLQPYFKEYGIKSVLPIFTEAVRVSPQLQLQSVADFIGHEKEVEWNEGLQPQNVSRERIRTLNGHKWLIESKLMIWLRRTFIPKSLRNQVKKSMTMQERPKLSDENIVRLTAIFDADFKLLTEWLGMTLTCESYVDQVHKNET